MRRIWSLRSPFLLAMLTLIALPAATWAAPVQGILNIGGSDAQVSATFLNFLCFGLGAACPTPPGSTPSGDFLATGTQTGDFVPYAGNVGFIQDLNQTTQPLNSPFYLDEFLVFQPGEVPNDIELDLTFIYLGTSGQAGCLAPPDLNATPAQQCTPVIPALVSPSNPLGLSPFNLRNDPGGAVASFSVAGYAERISTGELTPFRGVFSAQFANTPYQTLLANLSNPNIGIIQASYSANFDAVIPEPATMGLVGGALVLLGAGALRRRRQVSN
jgi:hypothetical protein